VIVTGEEALRWMAGRVEGTFAPELTTAIGWKRHGQVVAAVCYDGYNGANINMHVASDGSKHWLNKEFLWFVFYYPFRQLKVKRITGIVPSGNGEARRFDEKIGFELEATLKDAHPQGDLLIYKMTPETCRWLALKGTL
jgi:hypothetical protein